MASFTAHLVDGQSAARRVVQVTLAADGILIAAPDAATRARWDYGEVQVTPDEDERGSLRLARGRARLAVEDPRFAAALYEVAPQLRPAPAARRILYGTLAVAASLAAVAAIWWVLPSATDRAVALIPPALEERLGDQQLKTFGLVQCRSVAGQLALDNLASRLTARADLRFHVKVIVADMSMVNAFALPGGRIVVLRGLLAQAKSPDEVAGVLAHELTHTLKRHPLRHLMAQTGVEVLTETMLGYNTSAGNVGALMASFTYSRSEEAEADAGAIELLRQADISTAGFADFFDRLSHGAEQAIPPYLSNHPSPADRLAAVRAAGTTGTTPALSPLQWTLLQRICDGPKPADK